MDTPDQSNNPELHKFDKWLATSKIEPPADLLANIRAYLRDSSTQLDRQIDALFEQDPSLRDSQMVWKVRGRLLENQQDKKPVQPWFSWLAPIAACATLVLALISFQSQGPDALNEQATAVNTSIVALDLDEDMTRIVALAANLEGNSDLSKLESVEKLSFLFE